jgi:hypothetical protein
MSLQRIDLYHRLESRRGDRDLDNGFAARIHDPLWFLARQWQMGEHQGENASTPVMADCLVRRTPIEPIGGDPAFDPAVVPAEALVESELEDWWTMGRRVRAGKRLADKKELGLLGKPAALFQDPPPPYQAFSGKVDGRAVWVARDALHVEAADFGDDAPPRDSPDRWDPLRLSYFADFDSSAGALQISDHRGGAMDWYSADAAADAASGNVPEPMPLALIPTPLEYPGAPHSRFWEIENGAVDIGGYAPDTAHFPSMLLVELIYAHSDDWFLLPIDTSSGSIAAIMQMKITDGFGEIYDGSDKLASGAPTYPGLSAPDDFSIYRCAGLTVDSLVVWPVAEGPLESAPIERVQLGIDEQANVLWALERIVDSRQASRTQQPSDEAHPPYPPSAPLGDLSMSKIYAYKPATGIETHWHPYQLDWNGASGAEYVQWGLADYSLQTPMPMPRPAAKVLSAGTPETPELHKISAAVLSGGGVELERRWQLSRDINGRPVLWIERQRHILRAPPARNMRFDILEESS